MNRLFKLYIPTLIFLSGALGSLILLPENEHSIQIIDIKTAENIDEKYKPIHPTDTFTTNASKVYCWFEWKNAKTNSQVIAEWTYKTEKVPILDYKFLIPRREGAGGIGLSMPEGKKFPSGEYEVSLKDSKNDTLKFLKFKIQDQ